MAASPGAPPPPSPDEHVVDTEVVGVVVRRRPRYGRLLWAGVIAGLVGAVAMTAASAAADSAGGRFSSGLSGTIWVFGVYAVVFVGAGLLLSGVLALALGPAARSRRIGPARHDITLVHDLRAPVDDVVPRWAVQADDLAPAPPRPRRDEMPSSRGRPDDPA
ncbi:hypothetical protein [Microbacterium sp. CJ88]|uniref:hypothetical protein n=1 Tax=Microbacterium sp. CJ88 TaxID=3445672 RepID=UPI003F65FDCD